MEVELSRSFYKNLLQKYLKISTFVFKSIYTPFDDHEGTTQPCVLITIHFECLYFTSANK